MKLHAIFLSGLLATPVFADPVEGVWQTQAGDDGAFGHVEIAPCGEAICGTLVRAYQKGGTQIESATVGRQIVWAMEPAANGRYKGGKIWAPDRDKTYNSKMSLSGDMLNVSGCVLGICRTQVWRRVK